MARIKPKYIDDEHNRQTDRQTDRINRQHKGKSQQSRLGTVSNEIMYDTQLRYGDSDIRLAGLVTRCSMTMLVGCLGI